MAVALTIGLVGGVAAYAKNQFSDPHKLAEHMVSHISDELDLSAPQTESLRALADELAKMKTQMASDISADKRAMRELITAQSLDQAKALELVNAKTTALTNSAPTVIAALGTFLDGLDAEQKAEIAEHMDKHKGHHRNKHFEN
jgi:Spy/CpxP family protein refolding chaperone